MNRTRYTPPNDPSPAELVLEALGPDVARRLAIAVGRCPPRARSGLVCAVEALSESLIDEKGACQLCGPPLIAPKVSPWREPRDPRGE